jgi:hypothetical protein
LQKQACLASKTKPACIVSMISRAQAANQLREDNNGGKTLGFTAAWTGKKVSCYQQLLCGSGKEQHE